MTKAVTKQSTATSVSVDLKKEYNKLGVLVVDFANKIFELGKQICLLLDNDPEARLNFRKMGIPPSMYTRLEKVGRGTLLPALVDRPYFEKLPVDQQKLIVTSKVTAVIDKGNGEFDTMLVDVLTAEKEFVDRIVAKDHIRTVAEQRQWLISKRKPITMEESIDLPWTFVGRKVEIKGGIYTYAQIQTLLKSLKAHNK